MTILRLISSFIELGPQVEEDCLRTLVPEDQCGVACGMEKEFFLTGNVGAAYDFQKAYFL